MRIVSGPAGVRHSAQKKMGAAERVVADEQSYVAQCRACRCSRAGKHRLHSSLPRPTERALLQSLNRSTEIGPGGMEALARLAPPGSGVSQHPCLLPESSRGGWG